jgi:ribose transport system permease protein
MDKRATPIHQKLKALLPSRQMGMFLVLIIVVFGIFTFIIPNFNYVRIANLNNMLTDSVIPAIFAFGMGMILAVGGFDLSLGHIASLAALIIAYLMSGGIKLDPVSAILVGVLAASVIGLINGLLVSRMGISSFIVTLGMQFLIIGFRQIVTHGQSVYISNSLFKSLAKTQLGVSNLVFVLLIMALLCYLLMEKSTFGRKVQFIGENIEASRFMGINVKQLTMYTFIFGAVCAAIGGALFAARAGAVQINSVDSKLLDAITIAVFSGVIFSRFRVMGIIMVAILISMISTGMSMLGIKTEWIEFIKGLILLSSIFFAKFMSVNTSLLKFQIFHKLRRSN